MSLTYALYPNPVKKGEPQYRALIKNREQSDIENILTRMERYRSTISRVDAVGTLELFFEVIEEVLSEGGVVNLPLFKAQCSVSGNFTDPSDHFNSKRHKVQVTMKPGKRLKELTNTIKPVKTGSNLPTPFIKSFSDMATGKVNSEITPGSPAIIKGKKLVFDPIDPGQGIFFMPEKGIIPVKAETIHVNTFSQLVFIVPANLSKGNYRIQIANNYHAKEIRRGELDKILGVL